MLKTAPFSTRPLYLQVRDLLVSRITAGEWKPRSALPNEVDLARDLSVSPGTVRRALEQMEDEHLIHRRQGRGTFVADQASDELAIRYTNIRTPVGARVAADVKQVEVEQGPAHEAEQKRLRLRAHAHVTRVRRIHRSGHAPIMVEDAILPDTLFPGLETGREIPHGITLLAQQFGILLGRAEERVKVGYADPKTAAHLSITETTPVLELDRVVYALDGRPAEWRRAKCHFGDEVYWTEID